MYAIKYKKGGDGMGRYPEDVVRYMRRQYLARVIAAYLCAPQDDDEEEREDEDENGVSVEQGS